MNKEDKNKVIGVMITLLSCAMQLPVFMVGFEISAPNSSIRRYLNETTDKTDWNGKPLSDDEIKELKKERILKFEESKGYNPLGVSILKMTKAYTLQDITFENIEKLVCGRGEGMPDDYKFIGNVKLQPLTLPF